MNVVYLFWIVMAKVASSSYFVCSSIVLVVWFLKLIELAECRISKVIKLAPKFDFSYVFAGNIGVH